MLTLKRDAKRYCNFNWCVSRTKILSFGSLGNGRSEPGTRIWIHRNDMTVKNLLQERREYKQTNKKKSHPKLPECPGSRRGWDGAGSPFVQCIRRHRAP